MRWGTLRRPITRYQALGPDGSARTESLLFAGVGRPTMSSSDRSATDACRKATVRSKQPTSSGIIGPLLAELLILAPLLHGHRRIVPAGLRSPESSVAVAAVRGRRQHPRTLSCPDWTLTSSAAIMNRVDWCAQRGPVNGGGEYFTGGPRGIEPIDLSRTRSDSHGRHR